MKSYIPAKRGRKSCKIHQGNSIHQCSWDSSVSTVPRLRVDYPGLCLDFRQKQEAFLFFRALSAHPASYLMDTWGISPGAKRPRREADLVFKWNYSSIPPHAFSGGHSDNFANFTTLINGVSRLFREEIFQTGSTRGRQ